MGIVTTPALAPVPNTVLSHSSSSWILEKPAESFNLMSQQQDYQQGIFSFSNGLFERSTVTQPQIPRGENINKVRLQQGFEGGAPPPSLVGIEEEEPPGGGGGLPVYETAGMLSEMFNFPPAVGNSEWYGSRQNHHNHHPQISSINAHDSAAAMQLFLMNPQTAARSPSPPPSTATNSNSTLHMLLPNPSSNSLQGFAAGSGPGGSFSQFTWVPDHTNNHHGELGGVNVEAQGLSLSLSSSLEAAKAEELRMGDSSFLYNYNQGHGAAGPTSSSTHHHHHQFPYKAGLGSPHQQAFHNLQQGHIGFGSSSLGVVNVLRNSKYVKAAQELLEEFCSVGRGHFKKTKFSRQNSNPNSNPGAAASSSSSKSKDPPPPPLSAADRIEHQRRKVKLLSMLDEVERRYNHYCEQMQMVVNSFDLVMGFGAAVPYTALAQKAMSRHFRCLKDAISLQLKQSCEMLGEKDGAGTSGLTKGETPRLKMLEQSLRQQRAFNQMGMMDQEAWRPQRGLPERSVNILRAWLFEHFLHPYPTDADKHLLARQTGLSRNQVSNWFINARVRLWKPMVEDMYQQELKEADSAEEEEKEEKESNSNSGQLAQTPTTSTQAAAITSTTTTAPPPQPSITNTPIGKRSEINASESDPSLAAIINGQLFSENQQTNSTTTTPFNSTASEVPPPVTQSFDSDLPHHRSMSTDDTCCHGSMLARNYGTASTGGAADIGSSLIRFGTTTGDVSLTLGLRHAGNMPENTPFSVRDFGGI